MRSCVPSSCLASCIPGLLFFTLAIQTPTQALPHESLGECRGGNCNTWKLPPLNKFAAPWTSRRPGYSGWRSTRPSTGSLWKLSEWRFSPGDNFWGFRGRTKPSWTEAATTTTTTARSPLWDTTTTRNPYRRSKSRDVRPRTTRAPPVLSRTTEAVPRPGATGAPPWSSEPHYRSLVTQGQGHGPPGRQSSPDTSRDQRPGPEQQSSSRRQHQTTSSPHREKSMTPPSAADGGEEDSEGGSTQWRSEQRSSWRNRPRYQWTSGSEAPRGRTTTEAPRWRLDTVTGRPGKRRSGQRRPEPSQDSTATPTTSGPQVQARSTVQKSYSPYAKQRTKLPSWWYRTTQAQRQRGQDRDFVPVTTPRPVRATTTTTPQRSDRSQGRRKSKAPSWITKPPSLHPTRKTGFHYPSGNVGRKPSRSRIQESPKPSPEPTAARWIKTAGSPQWKPQTTKSPYYRHRYDVPGMPSTRWPPRQVVTAYPEWRPRPKPSTRRPSTRRPYWDSPWGAATSTPRPHSPGDYYSDDSSRYGYPDSHATQSPPDWDDHSSTKSPYLRTRVGQPDWGLPTSLPYWKKATETPYWRRPTTPAWKAKLVEPDWKTESDGGSHWSRYKTRPRPTTSYDALLEPTPPWDCEEDERTDQQRWRAMLYSLYGAWYQNGPLAPLSRRRR